MVFADYTFIRLLPYNRLYNYHGGVLMIKKFVLFLDFSVRHICVFIVFEQHLNRFAVGWFAAAATFARR